MVSKAGVVNVSVPEVHVSADIRGWDFNEDTRILVVLDLASKEPAKIDLNKARLRVEDLTNNGLALGPMASGQGEPPSLLQDGEFASVITLKPNRPQRVWVAFGGFQRRAAPEMAQRIELSLAISAKTETTRTLVLSDPGNPPIWRGKPVESSEGLGISAQFSSDETAANFIFSDSRYAVGPIVLGIVTGIGLRRPQVRSEEGQELVFGNLQLQARLAWPLLVGRIGSLAPFIGFDSAIMTAEDNVKRPYWLGPGLGVEVAFGPFLPRHGPFPIDYPQTPLGAFNLSLGLVHWFGPDREPPSFGVVFAMSTAYAHLVR